MDAMSQRTRPGFTLIEILACLLLFTLGLMAVIGVFLYGVRTAAAAQADATAWATALSVAKDPMPQGGVFDPATGSLTPWTWSSSGATWTADDGSGQPVWEWTSWPIDSAAGVVVADIGDPQSNAAAAFPAAGGPAPGCARGWLNGYYVERREQSLGSDRLGDALRLVEVRVDVYWAGYGAGERRPLASVVDRVVRSGGPP